MTALNRKYAVFSEIEPNRLFRFLHHLSVLALHGSLSAPHTVLRTHLLHFLILLFGQNLLHLLLILSAAGFHLLHLFLSILTIFNPLDSHRWTPV